MKDRFARFAPLISGVLFVVFVVLNNAQTSSTPDNSATGKTVLAYYKAHGDKMGGAGFSLALSVVAGLFFYGILRSYLRTSKRALSGPQRSASAARSSSLPARWQRPVSTSPSRM